MVRLRDLFHLMPFLARTLFQCRTSLQHLEGGEVLPDLPVLRPSHEVG